MKLPAVSFPALASMAPLCSTSTATNTAPAKQEEMAARKLEQAKQAVQTLATIKTKAGDAQRARAAQKVKELKARLQALKMLYAGDPKKLARAAAQIARELAGAVKSHTSAGGSTTELGGADSGEAAGGPAPQVEEAKADASGTQTPDGAVPSKEKAEADHAAAKPDAAASGAAKSADDRRASTAARNKADEEFRNEARALARELKAALRRKDPKHRDDSDQRSGEQALASVEQAVGALPIADTVGAAVAAVPVV